MRTDKRTPVVSWNETIIKINIVRYKIRQSRINIVSDQMIMTRQYHWFTLYDFILGVQFGE